MQNWKALEISSTRCAKVLARALPLPCAPLIVALAYSTAVQAHHSFAKFDRQSSIEIEGEVVDVSWQNPHVHFIVRGKTADGRTQEWGLETNSLGILRRMDVNPGLVAVGDAVKVDAYDCGAELSP